MDYNEKQTPYTKEQQHHQLWKQYMESRESVYKQMLPKYQRQNMISEVNWVLRHEMTSSKQVGFAVEPGDICFMDYGQAYLNEMGYQHFGLVMNLCQKKALVVPLTSNEAQYASAFDEASNPHGKTHLMRIGKIPGLTKNSVLFLNDMKWVNTARMIDVKAHIDAKGALFHHIQQRLMRIMFMPGQR